MLDMDTNTDAMSSTLLHMRHQLNDSHRQINILTEENTRLKTLCQSTTTPNGTTHTDSSTIVSTTTNTNNNNTKLPQKRPHPSNRTTQNVPTTNKVKTTTNLYDVDETTSPPSLPISLPSNEIMDIETNSTNNNIYNNNNNNNEHLKRTNPLENGINITP
jgi:hypothetical protein